MILFEQTLVSAKVETFGTLDKHWYKAKCRSGIFCHNIDNCSLFGTYWVSTDNLKKKETLGIILFMVGSDVNLVHFETVMLQ